MISFEDVEVEIVAAMGKVRILPIEDDGDEMKEYFVLFDRAIGEVIENTSDERLDSVMNYVIDQYDSGCGDDQFLRLSNRLIDSKDVRRLLYLWHSVIAGRRTLSYRDATLAAMAYLINALEKIGAAEELVKAKEEMVLYASGKKRKLMPENKVEMSESVFWDIIIQAKNESSTHIERPNNLKKNLERFGKKSIIKFDQIFQEKLCLSYKWDLWAIAYIARGGCSDDEFLYFRAWLISEGRGIFEQALLDPESLVDLLKMNGACLLESILYAAVEAYEYREGKPLKRKDRIERNPAGVMWSEPDLAGRYPRAAAAFSWV